MHHSKIKTSSPAALNEDGGVDNISQIKTAGCSGMLHMMNAGHHARRGWSTDGKDMEQQSHKTGKTVAGHTWSARKFMNSVCHHSKSHSPSSSATWAENRKNLELENFSSNHHSESTTELPTTCLPRHIRLAAMLIKPKHSSSALLAGQWPCQMSTSLQGTHGYCHLPEVWHKF